MTVNGNSKEFPWNKPQCRLNRIVRLHNMIAGKGLESSNGSLGSADGLPEPYKSRFQKSALEGEKPIAWIRTDLDSDLRYSDGLVLLTDRRLIAFAPVNGQPTRGGDVSAWPLAGTATLDRNETA